MSNTIALDPRAAAEANIEALDRVGRDIRRAILSTLPCAADQYVTISMPGRVIDVRPGGEFIKPETASAAHLHQIRVNEARLVDSMIPLDTVMLGPTGKSVVRSYLAALDYIIPTESEVRLPSSAVQESNEKPSNYRNAMNYLRKPIAGSKEAAASGGRPKTVVDIYVEKQQKFTQAQSAWDALQDKNAEDLEKEGLSADELEKRQSRMRTARFELQARWMDWVVNGDKIIVDHQFAIVDISTVMARIEASKEATRAANILDLYSGTQWAQVNLEPKDWAVYCREKALGWSTRNPLSPAVIQLEIKRLLNLKASYEGYQEGTIAGGGQSAADMPVPGGEETTSEEAADIKELNKAQAELDALRKAGDSEKDKIPAAVQKVGEKKAALVKTHKVNKNKSMVKALDAAMSKGLKSSLAKKIASLDQEITQLTNHLAECNAKFQRGVNTVVGVELGPEDKSVDPVDEVQNAKKELENARWQMSDVKETGADRNLLKSGAQPAPRPDPWTKVVFTSSTTTESSGTSESSMSADAKSKIGGFWYAAEASVSTSKVTKELRQQSAGHTVTGSFSALMVKITRPWLHAELFSDYEIDSPPTPAPRMSPGPAKFHELLRTRKPELLSEFSLFPAYPTGFIVASDVELEITCSQSFASTFMESSSTDANLSVNYGPWGARASANLKTESSSANQRMEATSTGMKLSFQSPQIIGWVSEILPQLPRNRDPNAAGGLVGAPMKLF